MFLVPSISSADCCAAEAREEDGKVLGEGCHQTYQSMALGLLEIIPPIQRIEPTVQKEAPPLPLPHHETPLTQRLRILRQHQVDLVALQVAERPDHAVWRHDGFVLEHQALEPCWSQEVFLQREGGVHDQGVGGEREEEGAVWVEGHGVPDGGDEGPARGRAGEVVGRCIGVGG